LKVPVDFSAVLASMRPVPGGMSVTVPPDWLQGRTAFGGMQAAIAVRAMREALPEAARALPLRAAQTTFIGPVPGDTEIKTEAVVLRVGRSTCHARCDLLHEGRIACSVTGIFGAPRTSVFVKELPHPEPGVGPDDRAVATFAGAAAPAFIQHIEQRWAYGSVPFSGAAEPRSMIYVRLKDKRCEPEHALVALADAIPTPVLSVLQTPTPAVSLNWMLEILRDPARLDLDEWVLIDTDVRAGTDGYLSQTSVLYGADGHAYSVSHQTVGVFG
jgi:acyl-CoA thioesterase